MRRLFLTVTALLAFGSLQALAEPAGSPSADEPPKPLRRVFLVSWSMADDGYPSSGLWLEKLVEARIAFVLRQCGVEVDAYVVRGEGEGAELAQKMEAFHPDAKLLVWRRMLRVLPPPPDKAFLPTEVLEFSLGRPTWNVDELRTYWRASVAFPLKPTLDDERDLAKSYADAGGDRLVAELLKQGLLPGCPAMVPTKPPPRSAKRGSYMPTSTLRVAGALKIGKFLYPAGRATDAAQEKLDAQQRALGSSERTRAPGPRSDMLAPEQGIQGSIEYKPDLEAYLGAAAAAELEKIGVAVKEASKVLDGTMEAISVTPAAVGLNVLLRVRYDLKDASTGQILFSGVKETVAATDGTGRTEPEALHQVLRSNLEALVQDPEFAKALQ